MKRREDTTGITAEFSDKERRWVFPGLSSNMGGPKKGSDRKTGPMSDAEVTDAKGAAPSLESATKDYTRGAYQDAYDKLLQLEKTDPKIKDDPKYKKLRKHAEIELNINA